MGNIPLAAVLWESGFLFAGVIAYIYADLIVPQLIHIYRQIFGTKIGNRLTLILYTSMATAGFLVYYLFAALGLIPDVAVGDPGAELTLFGVDTIMIMNGLFILISCGSFGLLISGRKETPDDQVVEDPITGIEITVKRYGLLYGVRRVDLLLRERRVTRTVPAIARVTPLIGPSLLV